MGLVLCRTYLSGSFLESGDFTGDETFRFAVPDNFAFVLVEVGSSCCFSVSAIVTGSAMFSIGSVLGLSEELAILC